MTDRRRSILGALLAALTIWGVGSPEPALAQMGPDLNFMALSWARGRFMGPVICMREGSAGDAIRRVIISPGPRHARPQVDRIAFHPIEVDGAERCTDELGGKQPDLQGNLHITLPGRPRRDLAQAEFNRALRQEHGFEFAIVGGRLRVTGWGEERETKLVDFSGGVARMLEVRPGSDAARMLTGFGDSRRLSLEIESPEGLRVRLLLVQYDVR